MTNSTEDTKDVVIERTFNAPIESVWKMWTEAENFKKWYGPQGASIPTAEMDVRVGGKRHLSMKVDTPNGPMEMWFVGEYLGVNPMTRLSYTESMSDEAGNIISPTDMGMPEGHPEKTTVTVELTDMGGSTKMVMTHAGVPAESPGATGWNMAIDKLEKLLSGSMNNQAS